MNLTDLLNRSGMPEPWTEGEKIPWNDPDFSARMLREHLNQEHDAASRRFKIIDRQVEWIHHQVLSGVPTKILDLGCGPGLYTSRLARKGHSCSGIDFSPAAIKYANEMAQVDGLDIDYQLGDIRDIEFGGDYGLVMLIFGEFNVFRPSDSRLILDKIYTALGQGGYLLLEPHTYKCVQEMGESSPTWYTAQEGLFSDKPHLYLQENFWNHQKHVATSRYYVIDSQTMHIEHHAASVQAYTDIDYRALLIEMGYDEVEFYPSLIGIKDETQNDFFAILSRKNGH
jgi:SAM-dependent methyltransferase